MGFELVRTASPRLAIRSLGLAAIAWSALALSASAPSARAATGDPPASDPAAADKLADAPRIQIEVMWSLLARNAREALEEKWRELRGIEGKPEAAATPPKDDSRADLLSGVKGEIL